MSFNRLSLLNEALNISGMSIVINDLRNLLRTGNCRETGEYKKGIHESWNCGNSNAIGHNTIDIPGIFQRSRF